MCYEAAETMGSSEFKYTATRLRGITIMKIRDFLNSNLKTSDSTELQNCYWWLPYLGGGDGGYILRRKVERVTLFIRSDAAC